MKKMKKGIFKGMIMVALMLSMAVTVYAKKASVNFSHDNTKVYGVLNYNWKVGEDNAYANTSVSSGIPSLGASIFGYDKNGILIKSERATGTTSVTTRTIYCTASKFKSSHSLYNASGTVLDRVYLDVTN